MRTSVQKCNGANCTAINTNNAKDWVSMLTRNNRQQDVQLDFCPACASTVTIAQIPTIVDPPKPAPTTTT